MRIFFSAGEPSGDEHAAHLIRALRQRDSAFACDGFGGPEMQQEGCDLLYEMTRNAVMGVWQVLPLLAHFRRLVKQAEAHLTEHPADAVVLVDFPGFNWWIARAAHRRGIPVYYYLPPQLWAWAPWRIRRVRKWVDHVICALPFEYEWYRQRGVQATWVGHPFFDEVADQQLNHDTIGRLERRSAEQSVLALLPGSRAQEIERNWPVMLQVAAQVQRAVPGVRWIAGCYRPEHRQRCEQLQQESGETLDIHYESGQTSEVIAAADACLMVSGSVSLELLARRTPGVVLYRTSRPGQFAARRLLSCRYITLTNLIADEEIMPEFVSGGDPQQDIAAMSRHLIQWAGDPAALADRRRQMELLADRTVIAGATERTAELLLGQSAETRPNERAA